MALAAVPAIAAASAPASEADLRAAVLSIAQGPVSPESAAEIREAVAKGFARSAAYGGIAVLEAAKVAAVLDGSEARARTLKLEAAAAQTRHAQELNTQLEYEPAAKELEAARAAMTASLAGQNDGGLISVLFALGAVDLELHREDAAREAFRQARIYGAEATLPAAYSPTAAAAYQATVASLKDRTGASLEVLTSPAGARIVIDGRVAGISPLMANDLVDGPHMVRAEILGRLPVIGNATLAVGKTARLSLTLPPPVPMTLHAGTPEEELRSALAAGEALGVDIVLATGVVRRSDELRARTLLVDVRRRALIAEATVNGDPGDAALLEKAGSAAGDRLREHLQNVPPLPTPAALRFDETISP